MALAAGGWAAGQAVWTWYELGLRGSAPFPSVADVGFPTLPVFSVAAHDLDETNPGAAAAAALQRTGSSTRRRQPASA